MVTAFFLRANETNRFSLIIENTVNRTIIPVVFIDNYFFEYIEPAKRILVCILIII